MAATGDDELGPVFEKSANEICEFNCGICYEIVSGALRCSNGHLFCSTCAGSWVANDPLNNVDEVGRRPASVHVHFPSDADVQAFAPKSDYSGEMTEEDWSSLSEDLLGLIKFLASKSGQFSDAADEMLNLIVNCHTSAVTLQPSEAQSALVDIGRGLQDASMLVTDGLRPISTACLRALSAVRAIVSRLDVQLRGAAQQQKALDDVACLVVDKLTSVARPFLRAIDAIDDNVEKISSAAAKTSTSIRSASELVNMALDGDTSGDASERTVLDELYDGPVSDSTRVREIVRDLEKNAASASSVADDLLAFCADVLPDVDPRLLGAIRFDASGNLCGRCPVCRRQGDFVNCPQTDRAVAQLTVRCPFVDGQNRKCRWSGFYFEFRHHVHQLKRPNCMDDEPPEELPSKRQKTSNK